jgi:hypothetical protein
MSVYMVSSGRFPSCHHVLIHRQTPKPPEMLPLDLTNRYDVYCSPHGQPAVVYRDVLFNADFRSPLTDDNFGEIQV